MRQKSFQLSSMMEPARGTTSTSMSRPHSYSWGPSLTFAANNSACGRGGMERSGKYAPEINTSMLMLKSPSGCCIYNSSLPNKVETIVRQSECNRDCRVQGMFFSGFWFIGRIGEGVRVRPFANCSAMYKGSQQATNAYN